MAACDLTYQITPYSWGTCGLSFDNPQDWSHSGGLAFLIHAGQGGGFLNVDLFAEGSEGHESYVFEQDLTAAMEGKWVQIGIPWQEFRRVDWEANPGSEFTNPQQISGLAFGFGTAEDEVEGQIWIDDLGWMDEEESIWRGNSRSRPDPGR